MKRTIPTFPIEKEKISTDSEKECFCKRKKSAKARRPKGKDIAFLFLLKELKEKYSKY